MTQAAILADNASLMTTPTGTAPSYFCRAWVNFNGTGTPAIRASGNVSSITDNGTGDYTVNFTTAMPDANYGVSILATISASRGGYVSTYSTSSARVVTQYVSGTGGQNAVQDMDYVHVAIFR